MDGIWGRAVRTGMVGAALALAGLSMPSAFAQVAAPSVERAPGNVELPAVERRDPLLV